MLVTGGTGYIGSHTVLALLEAGASVVILDNLVNSCEEVLPRLRELAGGAVSRMAFVKVCYATVVSTRLQAPQAVTYALLAPAARVPAQADLCDKDAVEAVFQQHKCVAAKRAPCPVRARKAARLPRSVGLVAQQ